MTQITVNISDKLKEQIDRRVAAGGYKSADEYFATLVTREAEEVFVADEELEAKLLEGIDDPTTPVTKEDWINLHQKLDAFIDSRKAK